MSGERGEEEGKSSLPFQWGQEAVPTHGGGKTDGWEPPGRSSILTPSAPNPSSIWQPRYPPVPNHSTAPQCPQDKVQTLHEAEVGRGGASVHLYFDTPPPKASRPLAPAVTPAGLAPQPTLLPHSLGLRNPEGKLLRPLAKLENFLLWVLRAPWASPPAPQPGPSPALCHAFRDLSFSSPRAL